MKVDFESQDIILELSPEGQDGKSVRPLGDWSATEEYHALDLVTYQGESFIALKDVPEGTLPTDTEYWMINASNKTVYWGTIEGTLAEQTDLATALADKADADTVYTKTETDSLLADKADADTVYTKAETDDLLDAKADSADVYTKTETDNLLNAKADADNVYTKAETDGLLNDKADADSVYTKTEADALLAEKADSDDVYTKTETDTLLSAKANTADLGDLAEKDTVDYQTEVTNKPTLGSLSSLDSISYESNYLTDKPVLGTMSAEDDAPSDDAQYVRKNGAWEDLSPTLNDKADVIKSTASGSLVHVTDAAAMPVDALTVGIEPVQGGSGTPSPDNVRPISGHTSAVVTRTGKNLIDDSKKCFTSAKINIGATENNGLSASLKAGTYTFSVETADGSTTNLYVGYYSNPNVSFTNAYNVKKLTFTITEDSDICVWVYKSGYTSVTDIKTAQLEYGSTATAYEPYQGTSVTIDLGDERYSGIVDVRTGVLTVMWKSQTLDDNVPISNDGYRNLVERTDSYTVEYGNYRNDGAIGRYSIPSDKFAPYKTSSLTNIPQYSVSTATDLPRLYFSFPKTYDTLEKIQAWFGNNPTQVVYPLATPFTVQLTPAEQLSLLEGTNNVWADTGDVNVGYRADTKLYIERLTQPTEDDMTANVNIASGKYFMVGNSLYLSTASIASGETIVPGTNCTALSLADALNNLS